MELVGKIVKYQELDGYLRTFFRCTNDEEFEFLHPPTLDIIPEDTLVRVFTNRLQKGDGWLSCESGLSYWEQL